MNRREWNAGRHSRAATFRLRRWLPRHCGIGVGKAREILFFAAFTRAIATLVSTVFTPTGNKFPCLPFIGVVGFLKTCLVTGGTGFLAGKDTR